MDSSYEKSTLLQSKIINIVGQRKRKARTSSLTKNARNRSYCHVPVCSLIFPRFAKEIFAVKRSAFSDLKVHTLALAANHSFNGIGRNVYWWFSVSRHSK